MLRRILPSTKLGHKVIKRSQSNKVDPNTPYFLQSLAWFVVSAGGVGVNSYLFWQCEKDYKKLFNSNNWGRKIIKGVMTIPEDFDKFRQIQLELEKETEDKKINMVLNDLVKFNPIFKEQVGVPMNVYVYGIGSYPMRPYYIGCKDDTFRWARNHQHIFWFFPDIAMICSGIILSGYFLHQMKRSLIRLR